MKTSTGLECAHDDQLIAGMCSVCDKWGETHGSCVDCDVELDDEDADKEFIHVGSDQQRRCGECHEPFERSSRYAKAMEDIEAKYSGQFDEWKSERNRS